MAKTIGIDLGTTNSCMAILEHGQANIIASSEGQRTIPSVVSYSESEEPIVGVSARRKAILNPAGTISSIKRFIGRTLAEVNQEEQLVAYQVLSNELGAVRIGVGDQLLSPEEIAAQIIAKIKSDAEEYLGESVDSAVITVPAYFNDAQRQSTKQAAEIAGLEVLRLVNEPTAAALAYGFGQGREERLLVFDMGGGTLDVSVLDVGDDVFEVVLTSGDNHLGGDDFDKRIVDRLLDQFRSEHFDLDSDPEATQRLYDAAEAAKIELSTRPKTEISLPFIAADPDSNQPLHLNLELTRDQLEDLSDDLLKRAILPLEVALEDLDKPIDQVILVGGMTRMPALIERVTRITHVSPRRGVNPDEAVAAGAAIQAGVLTGVVQDVLLLDVIPLSLGIAVKGDVMKPLIEANTTIPARMTETFTTAKTDQTSVEVRILQGERAFADDNRTLGRLKLLGIPPAEAGVPQIEVVFDVNADGILNVSALDLGTGAHKSLEITSATGLESSEVERLRLEAAEHREEDGRARRAADILTRSSIVRDQAGRSLRESGAEMNDAELAAIEHGYQQLSQLLVNEDPEPSELRKIANKLASAIQAFQARIYGAAGLGFEDVPEAEAGEGAIAALTDSLDEELDQEFAIDPDESIGEIHPPPALFEPSDLDPESAGQASESNLDPETSLAESDSDPN